MENTALLALYFKKVTMWEMDLYDPSPAWLAFDGIC